MHTDLFLRFTLLLHLSLQTPTGRARCQKAQRPQQGRQPNKERTLERKDNNDKAKLHQLMTMVITGGLMVNDVLVNSVVMLGGHVVYKINEFLFDHVQRVSEAEEEFKKVNETDPLCELPGKKLFLLKCFGFPNLSLFISFLPVLFFLPFFVILSTFLCLFFLLFVIFSFCLSLSFCFDITTISFSFQSFKSSGCGSQFLPFILIQLSLPPYINNNKTWILFAMSSYSFDEPKFTSARKK